jgi:hypothetical protein
MKPIVFARDNRQGGFAKHTQATMAAPAPEEKGWINTQKKVRTDWQYACSCGADARLAQAFTKWM